MHSHLVAILIAGLMLLPISRLTPVGAQPNPQPMLGDMCPLCPETKAEPGTEQSAQDSCCAKPQAGDETPEPCRKCPPICCTVSPTIALALPTLPPPAVPTATTHALPRASDEHARSRTLTPDPPVPIS